LKEGHDKFFGGARRHVPSYKHVHCTLASVGETERVFSARNFTTQFSLQHDPQIEVASIQIWRSKGKAVPLQAWSGPEGSRKLSFHDFMTTAQDDDKVVSYAPAAFTPRKYTWYSFLVEAESTPGP